MSVTVLLRKGFEIGKVDLLIRFVPPSKPKQGHLGHGNEFNAAKVTGVLVLKFLQESSSSTIRHSLKGQTLLWQSRVSIFSSTSEVPFRGVCAAVGHPPTLLTTAAANQRRTTFNIQ